MKKLGVISMCFLMLLVTGCSPDKSTSSKHINKSKWKDVSENISADIKATLNKKQSVEDEKKVSSSSDDEKDKASVDEKSTSTQKKNTNDANASQSTSSSQTSSNSTNGSGNQQTTEQEQPKQPQPQEPSKPVDPTPKPPACDDTIPSGAYTIDREKEIDEQIQAEMIENQVHGDGKFTQYQTEYGYTACGTKYFYIIRIYS